MIVNGDAMSNETIAKMLNDGHSVAFNNGRTSEYPEWPKHFINEPKTLGEMRTGEPVEIKFTEEAVKPIKFPNAVELYSYTVVLNSPKFGENVPHISHVETSVKARDFDEAVNLVKLLKFELELEITSISKDR